jgi:hypothetical protein
MQAMQQGKGSRSGVYAHVPALLALCGLAVAAFVGGCSSIETPLPEIRPISSTSLSQEDRKKAVDELNRKGATQEQDAEHQIEQSR